MPPLYIAGLGAVTPAGWGVPALRQAIQNNRPLPTTPLDRPGLPKPLPIRRVPPPSTRPWFISQPRLRRTSPITHFTVAAACEALGLTAPPVAPLTGLGIIFCTMTGCVNYSRRFYDETLRDPATASPLVFPETVFNAPASHLASLLGATTANYTLIGDPGIVLQALALAAQWLAAGTVNSCLVVAAEEIDWLTAEALHLLAPDAVSSEGAAALLLTNHPASHPLPSFATLAAITDPHTFATRPARADAAQAMRRQLTPASSSSLLCDGLQNSRHLDPAEADALADWPGPRLSPKAILGEAFAPAAAWQCIAALDTLARNPHDSATVTVVGLNHQALAARFEPS